MIDDDSPTSNEHVCDAPRSYHSEGLRRLRAGSLEEIDGDLIVHLMNSEGSEEVVSFARKWIQKYTGHECAPLFVGHWMRIYGASAETIDHAERCIETATPWQLGPLMQGLVRSSTVPKRLWAKLHKRLEADPLNEHWFSLQLSDISSEEIDRLILRWLELNRSSSEAGWGIAMIALFTKSQDIIESILLWVDENSGKSIDDGDVLHKLLLGNSEALLPKVVAKARAWLEEHSDREECARIFQALMEISQDERDFVAAKNWYMEHLSLHESWRVVAAVLETSKANNWVPEPYFIEEAHRIISKQDTIINRFLPAILVESHPISATTVEMKRIADPSNELVIALLKVAPDNEISALAYQRFDQLRTVERTRLETYEHPLKSMAGDLLVALLAADPTNKRYRDDAKEWLKVKRDAETVKRVSAALN